MQKRSKSCFQKGFTNILQRDDCYAIAALKEHGDDFCIGSKVKRHKPTSAPAAAQISSPQNDLNPKYYHLRQVKGHGGVKSKEPSLQDIAKLMKSRLSPGSRQERTSRIRKSDSPGTINPRKYSRYSSLSPTKHLGDGTILRNLKDTRNESLSPRKDLRDDAKAQEMHRDRNLTTMKESLSSYKDLREEPAMNNLRSWRQDSSTVESDINKEVTRTIRRQRMQMLRSLAEQLVKRVDAACAEQQLQTTHQIVSESTFEAHMDLDHEPLNQQVGYCCTDEPLEVELKICSHSPQPDILHHGHLSESEQAGCEIVELRNAEHISEVVPSVNEVIRDPVTVDTLELENVPGSETSPRDWNMVDKGMSTDNIPSGCSSYGPSSPSTDSSSPVILPTGAKSYIGRIKRNKNVEEQARKRQKEAWTLPAEEDIHSVINLYTQHWLSREKKKNKERCDLTHIGQDEFEENACPRLRLRTPLQEHAPEKHRFKFGSAPLCSELEMSDRYIKSLEADCLTSTKSADSSGVHTELPENDLREPVGNIMQDSTVDYIDVVQTPSPLGESMATIGVNPTKDENCQEKEMAGVPGQKKSERMLVQIGDLKVCHSPTSFHLRFETQKDDRELKKTSADLSGGTFSEMEKKTADNSNAFTGLSEEHRQTFLVPLTPMKITYARRLRTKTQPDGECTDDERIVVEVQPMIVGGEELGLRNESPVAEKSGSLDSEKSKENLGVNLAEVQNWNNPRVQEGSEECHDKSETLKHVHIFEPEVNKTTRASSAAISQMHSASEKGQKASSGSTCSRSLDEGAETLTKLSSPTEQSEEMMFTAAVYPVEETRCTNLEDKDSTSMINLREGRLGRLDTDQSKIEGDSVCSETKARLGSGEPVFEWTRRGHEDKKQKYSISSSAPSPSSRLPSFCRKNVSHSTNSLLHEEHSEMLSDVEVEVRPELPQKRGNDREYHLRTRRDQLEAELQKLDAEIRRTRAKLQTKHSVFDAKDRECDQIAFTIIAPEKPIKASARCIGSSDNGGVLPDDTASINLSCPLSANRALSDLPKQITHPCLPESAGSTPCKTLDSRRTNSTYSESFITEDIEMDGEMSNTRSLDEVHNVGERYENQYHTFLRQPKLLDERPKESGEKGKPNAEIPTEISEEVMNCEGISPQDEFVDEGSENSTGRIPWRQFGAVTHGGGEATVTSKSPQLKSRSSRYLEHRANTSASRQLKPTSQNEENEILSFNVAMKYNTLLEAVEDFTNCVQEKKIGALSNRDDRSHVKDTTWGVPVMKDDMMDSGSTPRSSGVAPAHDSKIQETSVESVPRGRRSIHALQITGEEDKLMVEKDKADGGEQPIGDIKLGSRDAQGYREGVCSSLQFGSSLFRTTAGVSKTELPPWKHSTSPIIQNEWLLNCKENESAEDEPIPNEREADEVPITTKIPSHLQSQKCSEVENVVDDSPSSSEDWKQGNIRTRPPIINDNIHSSQLPSSLRHGNKEKSNSNSCVSNPSLPVQQPTNRTSKTDNMTEDSSSSSKKDEDPRKMESAAVIGPMLQHPKLLGQIGQEIPSTLKDSMAPQEKSEFSPVSTDSLIDAVSELFASNSERKSADLTSLQDDNCSIYEAYRIGQPRRASSEIPQNLSEESEREDFRPLQRKTAPLNRSKEDRMSVLEAAESATCLLQDRQTKLLTDPSYTDVHLTSGHLSTDNLNELVMRRRLDRMRHYHPESVPLEIKGLMPTQQSPRPSIRMAEGLMTDECSEMISASQKNNGFIRNPQNKLPHYGLPLPQGYSISMANAPLRSYGPLEDSGKSVMAEEAKSSADLHQSAELRLEIVEQGLPERQLCPPLTKRREEETCADIMDGLRYDFHDSRNRGKKHWEKLVALLQNNEKNRSLQVPSSSPQNPLAPAVQVRSSQVEDVARVLFTELITRTDVPEVIDELGTARGDIFRDCSHVKETCQRSILLEPSFLMSKDNIGFKELGNKGDDARGSWKRVLSPVLLSKDSMPSETLAGMSLDRGEPVRDETLTSEEQQGFLCSNSFGLLTNDKQLRLARDIHITVTAEDSKDCTSPRFGSKCTGESITTTKEEEKADLQYSGQLSTPLLNLDILRSPPRQPLNLFPSLYGIGGRNVSNKSEESDVSEELEEFESELDGENLDRSISKGTKGGEILKVHSPLDATSWKLTEMSCGLGTDSLKVSVCGSETDLRTENPNNIVDKRGEIVLTKSNEGGDLTESICPRDYVKLDDSSASTPILLSNLGEVRHEECMAAVSKGFEHLDLDTQSSWSEGHGRMETYQKISNPSGDERFDGVEVVRTHLEQSKSQGGEHISTTPPTAGDFTSQKSQPCTSWLSEEASRLVECFLSSGSELLDRASQVSRVITSSSVVDNNPGKFPSLDCNDDTKEVTKKDSSFSCGLPHNFFSGSSETAEDDPSDQSITCDPEGAKESEIVNLSRLDQITENFTVQEENIEFLPSSRSAHQSCKPGLVLPADSLSDIQIVPFAPEHTERFERQVELGTKKSCGLRETTSKETELLEFREFMNSVTTSVPQMASALAISLQIPEMRQGRLHHSNSSIFDEELSLSGENSTLEVACEDRLVENSQLKVVEDNESSSSYNEGSCIPGGQQAEYMNFEMPYAVETQDSNEQKLCRFSSEDSSTVTGHDQDSICSLDGSGGSQDLDGTLEDIKLQTAANRTGKHNMMADTLTEMLFETLLAEGLSEYACPSKSISQTARDANQTLTVSKTTKSKNKSRSKRGFVVVLKHFLPTGWRAASVKHKAGSFLEVEGLRPHPLSSVFKKSSSISENEALTGTFHNGYTSKDNFDDFSFLHRATTETAIPLLNSKDYVQSYVHKTLELSRLLNDPSPSNWFDSNVPVGQEIYRRVMETERSSRFGTLNQSEWQLHNKLLSDLVNESLIKISVTVQQSHLNSTLAVDGGNLVNAVTSRIVEHGSTALKHGPDIDKVVGKVLDEEQWEICPEEARDVVSDLAQGILCDLIDRFVQEMIKGRNNTCSRISLM
ncbi:hypothetical protein MPTK1_5g07905 [Marchantia polymorpha subsp. ruderalis]